MKNKENQILSCIKIARSEMEAATNLFNELTDTAAIDCAAYSLLAATKKYDYFMQIAKDEGLRVQG